MDKRRFSTRRLPPLARQLLNEGVTAVESATEATVVALVLVDERGVWINMRPGDEVRVSRLLETINWKQVSMITSEHIGS